MGAEEELAWRPRAACLGAPNEQWFPARGERDRDARLTCYGCPSREPCLEYAMTNHIEHGIWGGTSERQRRMMRAERAKEARILAEWARRHGEMVAERRAAMVR